MRFLRHEPLEQRQLLAGNVSIESAEIAYFLIEDNPRVERYDIEGENWLSSIDLPDIHGTATSLHVDEDGLYVAYGQAVFRYNPDGSGQTHLLNTQEPVQALHSDGDLLFINHSGQLYARFVSIDKTTNNIVDTIGSISVTSFTGTSVAPEENRIIGRSNGVGPADIYFVSYADDGTFTGDGQSPHHGDYPDASQTWMFPDGSKVVDDSGNVYSTSTITWQNTFASTIDDLDFVGDDVPIILRDNILTSYTNALLPAGTHTLGYTPDEIYVNETRVITFTANAASAHGFEVDFVSLNVLTPPAPGQPVDPIGVPYTPDHIEQAADGTILLYSSRHQSIFRWNPQTQSYIDTIPVTGFAEFMTYSADTNTIYLAYHSGLITQIDLDAPQPNALPFATLSSFPSGLNTAGPYVFTADASGSPVKHSTFAPDGSLVESVDIRYYARSFTWSEANQKMYFLDNGASTPRNLLSEEINADGSTYESELAGGIGLTRISPFDLYYHFSYPIHAAPDGSAVILGSGVIHDPETLQRFDYSLANYFYDAAWLGDELYTIRRTSGMAEVQHWSLPTYEVVNSFELPGAAIMLEATDDNRLVASTVNASGIPTFTVLDSELQPIQLHKADAAGLYSPATGTFYFHNPPTPDVSEEVTLNGAQTNAIPLAGDWNGDGVETIGIYNPANATFQLSNSNTSGVADIPIFNYGIPNWVPVAGDWDGDGIDTIGLYNPESATFFLRNSNDSGVADITPFNYGIPNWTPISGDWDGDGIDSIGIYNQETATFFLRNYNTAGISHLLPFNYGLAHWRPLAGDWNGDGIDSIGVYNPQTATFFLRNTNDTAASDLAPFNYGVPGMIPVTGAWKTMAVENQLRELAFATLELADEIDLTDEQNQPTPGNWTAELLDAVLGD